MTPRLLDVPMVSLTVIEPDEANGLFVAWGHRLGACNRPFTQMGYALLLDGEPISAAMSASTVGATSGGYPRQEVVELARLCSRPHFAWSTRVMIRLWRAVCAPRWPDWPIIAAVSYQQNAHYTGNIYRFDGWEKVDGDCGASTQRNHGRPAYEDAPQTRGSKSLWIWKYAEAVPQ
jgi:hypothetical protein